MRIKAENFQKCEAFNSTMCSDVDGEDKVRIKTDTDQSVRFCFDRLCVYFMMHDTKSTTSSPLSCASHYNINVDS